MKNLRPFVYAFLPIVAFFVVGSSIGAVLRVLAGANDSFAAVHDSLYLWLVTGYHQHEWWFVLVPTVLVIVGVPIAVRRPENRCGWILAGSGLAALAGSAMFIVGPYDLWRVSPWPYLGAFLVAAAVFAWLVTCWAYLPFRRQYAAPAKSYLRHEPRGGLLFELLSLLRPRQAGAADPLAGKRENVETNTPSTLGTWMIRRVLGMMKSPWARRQPVLGLIRFLAPRLTALPLAEEDHILTAELVHLRDAAREELEVALYGERERGKAYGALQSPELDANRAGRIRKAYGLWLAYTDALAECHCFGLLGIEAAAKRTTLEAHQRKHLLTAANLFAEAARLTVRPCLRATQDGPFTWKDQEETAARKASAKTAKPFIEKEILCLEVLAKQDHRDPVTRTPQALLQALGNQPKDLPLRFALAHLSHAGLVELEGGEPVQGQADNPLMLWQALDAAIKRRRALAHEELRARYFDAALFQREPSAERVADEITQTWIDLDEPDEPEEPEEYALWFRAEHRTKGHAVSLLALQQQDPGNQRQQFQRAIEAFGASRAPALRSLGEYVGELKRLSGQAAARLVVLDGSVGAQKPKAKEPLRPKAPPSYTWQDLHGTPDIHLAPSREPNLFTRLALAGISLAVFAVAVGFLTYSSAGAIVEPPYLPIGGGGIGDVTTISPGREAEPSVWVAHDKGVEIKGGGRDHHWYHLDTDDNLLSNDVRRVDVGAAQVAYLCADRERVGVCLSSVPSAPPGTWPWLGIDQDSWWTLLGFSSFPGVDDQNVTTFEQVDVTDGHVVLVGTSGGPGLGRYRPTLRRWLDGVTIDEAGGFLPSGHGTIHDITILSVDGQPHAWVATNNGIAGGPIMGEGEDGFLESSDWRQVVGNQLLDTEVHAVAARRAGSRTVVDYRTAGEGLGSVSAPGESGERRRVVIGQRSVPELDHSGLRDAVYQHGSGLVWTLDQPRAGAPQRVSAYSERDHEWNTQRVGDLLPATNVFELVADAVARPRVLVGIDGALVAVADEGGPDLSTERIELDGFEVRHVVPAPNRAGVVALGWSPALERASVQHLSRDALDPPPKKEAPPSDDEAPAADDAAPPEDDEVHWSTVVGTDHVPGLSLDDVTTAEALGDGVSLFLGTEKSGVVVVDGARREVRPFSPGTAAARPIMDLAYATNTSTLYRVGDWNGVPGVLASAAYPNGNAWKPRLGHSRGAVDPEDVRAVAAFDRWLVFGSAKEVSLYDMQAHVWTEAGPVGDLWELFVTAGELWVRAGRGDEQNLRVLEIDGDKVSWSKLRFDGVRGYDHTERRVITVNPESRISVWDQSGESKDPQEPNLSHVLTPHALGSSTTRPTCAAVNGSDLYVAPVNGRIGHYDLGQHVWTHIALPAEADSPKRLGWNTTGLWLWSQNDDVSVLYVRQASGDGTWSERLMENVEEVFFGADNVVARTRSGEVRLFVGTTADVLVGEGFDADLTGEFTIVEFDGALYFAAGAKLGRYDQKTHSWSSLDPTAPNAILQIEATDDFLYVLSDTGTLLRKEAGKLDWNPIQGGFRGATPHTIEAFGSVLVVLAESQGAFLVDDDAPDDVRWLQASSVGPPAEAEITCVAEVGTDLFLGTMAHGLWVYFTPSGDDPPQWEKVSDRPESVDDLFALKDRLVVRRANGIQTVGRRVNGWRETVWLPTDALVDVTASAAGVFVSEQKGSATSLVEANAKDVLIGKAAESGAGQPRAVAVDPDTGDVFRADSTGRVARYVEADHRWEPAEPNGGAVRDLFVAATRLWAWSPQNKSLHRWTRQGWKRFNPRGGGQPQPLEQVLWEELGGANGTESSGLLLLTRSGQLYLEQGQGAELLYDPTFAQLRVAGSLSPLAAVELEGWLVLGLPKACIAYHTETHRWTRLGDYGVHSFGPVTGQPNRGATGTFVVDTKRQLHRVHVNQVPDTQPIALPVGHTVEALFSAGDRGQRTLLLTQQGCLFERLVNGWQPLFEPVRLELDPAARLTAAAEWQGQLFLGFATAADSRLASYDPARGAWSSVEVAQRSVTRFFESTANDSTRLFAELQRDDVAAGSPTKELVEILLQGGVCTFEPRLRGLYDIATDGENAIWVVDADRNLMDYTLGGQPVPALPGEQEHPAALEALLEIGPELIVLAAGNLWHYSLETLRWHRPLANRTFVTLFSVSKEPHAVADDGSLYQYRTQGQGRSWLKLQGGQVNRVVHVDPGAVVEDVQWKVSENQGALQLEWRDPQHRRAFARVGAGQGRFDFNRVERIEYKNGQLWCATLAGRGAEPVYRVFDVVKGVLTELPNRFGFIGRQALNALAVPDPVVINGRHFRISDAPGGPWKGPENRTLAAELRHWENPGQVDPIPLVLVPDPNGDMANGGMAFSIDVWTAALCATGDTHLVVHTRDGLLVLDLPEQQTLRRHTWTSDGGATFVDLALPATGRISAAFGEGEPDLLRVKTAKAWDRETDRTALRQFRECLSIRRYNDYLTQWEFDADGQLTLKTGTGNLRVPLTTSGFEFDQIRALGLDRTHFFVFSPSGRATYTRGAPLGAPLALEPMFATSSPGPARAVLQNGNFVLLPEDPAASESGFAHNRQTWEPLTPPNAKTLRAELREPLHDGFGWHWSPDDSVRRTDAAWIGPAGLNTGFDSTSGQLTYDMVRALQATPDALWVATDDGVFTWRDGKPSRVELNEAPFGGEATTEADFVFGLDDIWYLELKTATGTTSIFAHKQGSWERAPAGARAVADARSWLHRGATWRAQVFGAANRELLRVTHPDGQKFATVRLTDDGRWDFELLHCVTGPLETLAIGTDAGVLEIVETGARHFGNTPQPVVRIDREPNAGLHVQTQAGRELLLDSALRSEDVEPNTSFEQKDALLLDNERWNVTRNADRTIHWRHRLEEGAGLETVRFAKPRFDFDTVHAQGLTSSGDVLLATDHQKGFLLRDLGVTGDSRRAPGLSGTAAGARIDRVWIDGGHRVLVDVGDVLFFQEQAGTWVAVGAPRDEDWRAERVAQVARNGIWNVRVEPPGAGLEFTLHLGAQPGQRVVFDRHAGGFTFDVFRDVLLIEGTPAGSGLVLLASDGGLCELELPGKGFRLVSDLDGDGKVDPCLVLTHTAEGPVVETQGTDDAASRKYFVRRNANWEGVPAATARDWIRVAYADLPDVGKWALTGPPQRLQVGAREFEIAWAGERVSLLDRPEARFAHDYVFCAEIIGNILWLATKGGTLQLELGTLEFAPGRSLLSSEPGKAHLGQLAPLSLRIADVDGRPTPVLRIDAGARETWHAWDESNETWVGTPPNPDGTVLVERPGFWTWYLKSRTRVEVQLGDQFQLPANASSPMFEGGTLAFWNLSPAGTGRAVAFLDDWFVATSLGVLRLAQDSRQTVRLYGRDGNDIPIAGVELVVRDGADLLAQTADGVFRFDAEQDRWLQEPDPPAAVLDVLEGQAPIPCAWLEITRLRGGEVQLGLQEKAADVPSTTPLLQNGRFLFDRARDFAWHDGSYWVVTPAGVATVDSQTGALFLHRDPFAARPDDLRVLVRDSRLGVVSRDEAWGLQNAEWSKLPQADDAALRAQFQTLAHNPLFRCTQDFAGNLAVHLDDVGEGFPVFHLGGSIDGPALLENGLFGFDAVVDAKLRLAKDLYLSTRIGMWKYTLDEKRRASLPERAIYLAHNDIAMRDLGSFRRDPQKPDELYVYAADPTFEFTLLANDEWLQQEAEPVLDSARLIRDDDGDWSVAIVGDELIVRHGEGPGVSWPYSNNAGLEERNLLGSVFATPSSIWIPQSDKVLWVRKSHFD